MHLWVANYHVKFRTLEELKESQHVKLPEAKRSVLQQKDNLPNLNEVPFSQLSGRKQEKKANSNVTNKVSNLSKWKTNKVYKINALIAPLPAILHTALSATFAGLRVPERDLGLPWIGVVGLDITYGYCWPQPLHLFLQIACASTWNPTKSWLQHHIRRPEISTCK